MTTFQTWEEAHGCAIEEARACGREVGIEKAREYTRTVYRVHRLPRPENRTGFELRCEIVRPTDPHLAQNVGRRFEA